MWHIYNGILLSIKEWNKLIFFSNTNGPRDYHTKQSKKEKNIIHIICDVYWHVESKTWHKWTYLWNIDKGNRLLVAKVGGGGGMDWEVGISTCKLLYAAAAAMSLQSCPTLCDTMDCSPLGCSVHGIFQAKVLEWVAIPFSKTVI